MGAFGTRAIAGMTLLLLGAGLARAQVADPAQSADPAITAPSAQGPLLSAAPDAISTGLVGPPPQILTLDQDRLYSDSLFGKALEQASSDAVAALVAENRQIESDLTAEEKALTDQRATLSAEAFKPLAEAFDAKVEGVRAAQEAKSKALTEARDAGRKRFFNAVLPILAEMMRQEGALAILNKNAVILSFDSIDATNAAILAIDASLGDGSALSPAPSPAP
jgi:Skp family chaperone for outer membrane proteins